VVVAGEIDWEVCDGSTTTTVRAKAGDFVNVPTLTVHPIAPRSKGSVSHGRWSHSGATCYISSVIIHTKYNKAGLNGSTADG
jgi:hypothetical protein